MAKSGGRKVVKPVAAAAVTLGTIASIWWFALKPRRKARAIAKTDAQSAAGAGTNDGGATTEQP
jgi:hypothetical protein